MRTAKLVLSIWLLIFIINSCSEDKPLQPSSSSSIKLSTFSEIQRQVFNPSCAVSGCHAGANPAANLNLTPSQSYQQLVDQPSQLVPGDKLVDPFSGEESVLVRILRGPVAQGTQRMPLGATPLSSATIDSIAKWINEGAQNN